MITTMIQKKNSKSKRMAGNHHDTQQLRGCASQAFMFGEMSLLQVGYPLVFSNEKRNVAMENRPLIPLIPTIFPAGNLHAVGDFFSCHV